MEPTVSSLIAIFTLANSAMLLMYIYLNYFGT
jgi:hypothetical protein